MKRLILLGVMLIILFSFISASICSGEKVIKGFNTNGRYVSDYHTSLTCVNLPIGVTLGETVSYESSTVPSCNATYPVAIGISPSSQTDNYEFTEITCAKVVNANVGAITNYLPDGESHMCASGKYLYSFNCTPECNGKDVRPRCISISCNSSTEVCDGVDNDCDGVPDNGVDMECVFGDAGCDNNTCKLIVDDPCEAACSNRYLYNETKQTYSANETECEQKGSDWGLAYIETEEEFLGYARFLTEIGAG
jgi:hypothetical protein